MVTLSLYLSLPTITSTIRMTHNSQHALVPVENAQTIATYSATSQPKLITCLNGYLDAVYSL